MSYLVRSEWLVGQYVEKTNALAMPIIIAAAPRISPMDGGPRLIFGQNG
ncbi:MULTISPECIES: hypothetical protein [Phaeobacter]